jgi:hypothetical protein
MTDGPNLSSIESDDSDANHIASDFRRVSRFTRGSSFGAGQAGSLRNKCPLPAQWTAEVTMSQVISLDMDAPPEGGYPRNQYTLVGMEKFIIEGWNSLHSAAASKSG